MPNHCERSWRYEAWKISLILIAQFQRGAPIHGALRFSWFMGRPGYCHARHLSSTQNSLENARRALEAAQREVPRALFAGVSMVFPVNWSEGTWFCCRYCYICSIIITIFIYYYNTYTIYKIWFRVSWCRCAAFQQFFEYVPWSQACRTYALIRAAFDGFVVSEISQAKWTNLNATQSTFWLLTVDTARCIWLKP